MLASAALVDSHCHLNYPEFSDMAATLIRAADAGVALMQTISTKRSDFQEVIALCEAHPPVYGSIGIHPHEAESHLDVTVEELATLAAHPKIIGIGETGLDYFYEHSPREAQQILFRHHIEAARVTGLPLIVHTRDAEADTIAILHEEYAKAPFLGLIHCFSSSKELAEKSIEIGFYISLSGILTFPKAASLREAVASLPMDRLLVETDAPYLAPVPYRGKLNEPSYVAQTASQLAEIKGLSLEEVTKVTTANFFRLFTKANIHFNGL